MSYEDRIDTRDLVAERDALIDLLESGEATPAEDDRLTAIDVLFAELRDYAEDDVTDGVFLISDYGFEEYAREFAEDCGMMGRGESWPLTCIDWEQAARELRSDYTSVKFDGVSYWYR